MSQKIIYIISYISAVILFSLAFHFQGTGDDGDSVFHYLYAHWAPFDTKLYFNHWAKPLFVLLASPWAQFGFIGIKIFNVVNFLLTQIVLYKICQKLNFQLPWLPSLLYLLCPMGLYYNLSGLTEPLFALLISVVIYLLFIDKLLLAIILISFLPFIRSEGLFVILLAIPYLIFIRKFQYFLLLSTGHIIYGLAGMHVYNYDFLWTIHKIPYPINMGSYGQGVWFHFIEYLPEVTGEVFKILFLIACIGIYFPISNLIKKRDEKQSWILLFFIFGLVFSFFLFHSYAWAIGKFNSFGLTRVLLAVLPLMIIMISVLFESIYTKIPKIIFYVGLLFLIALQLIFIFNPSQRFHLNSSHFKEKPAQIMIKDLVQHMKNEFPDWGLYHKLYANMNVALYSGSNPFHASSEYISAILHRSEFPYRTFLIWDSWYSKIESKVSLEDVNKDSLFTEIKSFQQLDQYGKEHKATLFKYLPQNFGGYDPEKLGAILKGMEQDPTWLKYIGEKAMERNISLDSMMLIDAKWMIDQEKK
ncbi:MAG: hypothetical protein M3Q56_08905 [Bacteroidota bacterium]|nr:hypothetical protein [Bacteroidota bacterium]